MKLKCLGSSSKGNCYIIESNSEALVIEAGIPSMEVKKAMNFDISKIAGVLISHRHKDHSKYLADYMQVGICVYTNDDVQEYFEIVTGEYSKAMTAFELYRIGNFYVQPFELVHNVPCMGFYIRHKDLGKLLFITDTEYVPKDFSGLQANHILIEANYTKDKMCNAEFKREHVLRGHMDINTTCGFLQKNYNPNLKNVVLLHLSDGSSNEIEFLKKAKESVSGNVNVFVADRGLEIEL